MKITKLQGLTVLSMLVVSTFSSCEEHNPFSEQELFEQEYSKNFFAKYGNFPADFNWDLSNAPRTAATDPSVFDLGWNGGGTLTRAAGDITVKKYNNYYEVDQTTLTTLKEMLHEGWNNTSKGNPFSLVYPTDNTSSFAIIPIYKGRACLKWELRLATASGDDVLIWEPWETFDGELGCESYTHDIEGNEVNITYTDDILYKHPDNGDKADSFEKVHFKADCDLATAIKSRPMVVSGVKGEFYLYLKTTFISETEAGDPSTGYGSVGDHNTSTEGMMLALNCDIPSNITQESMKALTDNEFDNTINSVKIIACEDNKGRDCDWDINDIVFLLVGLTNLPEERIAFSKRYMIEDMGSTVDWDFNDVVVDVTETYIKKTGDDNPTYGPEDIMTQEATIKHLCGTTPFTVYFDDESVSGYATASFKRLKGAVQPVDQEYRENGQYVKLQYVKGSSTGLQKPFWNSSANNIRVNVEGPGINWSTSGDDKSEVYTVKFPTKEHGSSVAPLIIALPITAKWTKESEDFNVWDYTELPAAE